MLGANVHVEWINPRVRTGQTYKVITGIPGKTGIVYTIDRETGQFLWARPFPYDDPNINIRVVDVKTGQTGVNPDKLFKKDGDTIVGCYHNTRGLWQIAYSEIYFTETLWPDFREAEYLEALAEFQRRERRFGRVSGEPVREQLRAAR